MSQSRAVQSSAVSLFPFLAVLICTMGALILMLLVTTRQIRVQEIARERALTARQTLPVSTTGPGFAQAAPTPKKPRQSPPRKLSDLNRERRIQESKQHEAEIQRQTRRRDQLNHELLSERESLTKARRNFETLQAQVDGVRERLDAENSARRNQHRQKVELTDEERTLVDDLEHARAKLLDLQARQHNAGGEFSLVPFDGKSGTTRRPIFIECTERGFRILSEDILLTPSDMNGFSERVNPLLAATEALTAYWTGRADVQPSEVDPKNPPYVLLIVRPSGTVAYYLARRFLSRAKEPFGYELVEEDYPLHVPPADPQTKRLVQQAIELTLASRNEILQDLASRRLSSPDRVDVQTFNNDVHAREELRKVEEMLPNRDGRPVAPPMRGTPGSANSEFAPLTSSPDQPRGNSFAPQGSFAQGRPSFNEEGSPTPEGRPGFSSSTSSGTGANLGSTDSAPGEFNSEDPSGTPGGSAQSGGSNRVAKSGSKRPLPNEGQNLPPGAQGDGEELSDSAGPSYSNTGKTFRPVTRQRVKPMAPAEDHPSQGRLQEQDSSEGDRTQQSDSPPTTTSAEPPTQIVPDRAAHDAHPPHRAGVPAGSVPRSITPRSRWGGNSAAGIGMQKKILIEVEADKIIVEHELEVPLLDGESREMLARRLLGAIDWAASQWGEPHKNYFWIPVVQFRVHPGCLPQQARMQGVLQNWGISSTVEFLKAEPSRKTTE